MISKQRRLKSQDFVITKKFSNSLRQIHVRVGQIWQICVPSSQDFQFSHVDIVFLYTCKNFQFSSQNGHGCAFVLFYRNLVPFFYQISLTVPKCTDERIWKRYIIFKVWHQISQTGIPCICRNFTLFHRTRFLCFSISKKEFFPDLFLGVWFYWCIVLT